MPTADPLWYNRLLFELAVEPGSDKEARVSYHEVTAPLHLLLILPLRMSCPAPLAAPPPGSPAVFFAAANLARAVCT